jgi:signal transduction histidine kinase
LDTPDTSAIAADAYALRIHMRRLPDNAIRYMPEDGRVYVRITEMQG